LPTILLVEDDRSLRETLAYNLQRQEYSVEAVGDGQTAVEAARRLHPNLDLVVLDLMLPKLDGFEVCRILRQEMSVPIIMLTARDDEIDRVIGLEIGADDYITKPFSMRELAARVRTVLRRVGKQDVQTDILRAADITLDRSGRLVKVGDRLVDLTASEFDLLAVLMAAPGRSFTRLELLERLQGTAYEGYERTIDVHIHNLRNKIEPEPAHPVYIETLYGAGYRFAAQMEKV